MTSTYKCTITVHAPLHIGCDEVYEPMGFTLDEDAHILTRFDSAQFIAGLDQGDRDTLSMLCRKGDLPSILQIYKFFRGRKAQGKTVRVSPEFTKHYQRAMAIPDNKIQQELNKFIIERTAFRTFDGRPFIPGSSVKGALRTGFLNHLCAGKRIPGDPKKMENTLLHFNRPEEDPFSHVKVSDFQPAGEIATRIAYAVNKKKKHSDREARGANISQILEIIEPGAVFKGEITVRQPHPKSPVRRAIELADLLSGTHDFYRNEHLRENRDLTAGGLPQCALAQEENGALIRMGRHSGAESVTVKGNRSIKIMTGKGQRPKLKTHATTLWLASPGPKPRGTAKLSPFGWACLSPLPPALETRLDKRENDFLDGLEQAAQKRRKQAVENRRQALEAQKRETEKQAALDQERKAEEERQKALEAMSPEDRELAEIFDTEPILENSVVDLFNRLDGMEEVHKRKSAEKIKAFYQACGKWKVNKKKKKQFEKVRKLKSILGEA